jgi:periplasmic copper chaperone A
VRRRASALVLLAVIACGGDGRDESPRPDTSAAATAAEGPQSPIYRAGSLSIHDVVAPAPVPAVDGAAPMAVYFIVMNEGAEADTLDAVEVARAQASLHDPVPLRGTGMEAMQRIETASIPAGETLRFLPGGRHVMVEGLTPPPAAGDTLAMTMLFRRAGRVPVAVRVVEYADLERVIEAGASAHAGH